MPLHNEPLHNVMCSVRAGIVSQTVAVVLGLETRDWVHHVEPHLVDGEFYLIL